MTSDEKENCNNLNERKIEALKFILNLYFKGKIQNSPDNVANIVNDVLYSETSDDIDEIMKNKLITW